MKIRFWRISPADTNDYDWSWLEDDEPKRPLPCMGNWLRREDAVAAAKTLLESVVPDAVEEYVRNWQFQNHLDYYDSLRKDLPFRVAAMAWKEAHPNTVAGFVEHKRVLDLLPTWNLPDDKDALWLKLSVQFPVVERLEVVWSEVQKVEVEGQTYSRKIEKREFLTDWLRHECTYGPQVMSFGLAVQCHTFEFLGTEEDLRAAVTF